MSITYTEPLTPTLDRYVDALLDGRIVGHRCPACGRVYVPGKGYCPCVSSRRGEADEVEVSDTRHGDELHDHHAGRVPRPDRDRAVRHASVLLDGTDVVLGRTRTSSASRTSEVRIGLRVAAVWEPQGEAAPTACRTAAGVASDQ